MLRGPGEDLDEVALHDPCAEGARAGRGAVLKDAGEEDISLYGPLQREEEGRRRAEPHEAVAVDEHLATRDRGKCPSAGLPSRDGVGRDHESVCEFVLGESELFADEAEHVPGDDTSAGRGAEPRPAVGVVGGLLGMVPPLPVARE